MSKIKGKNTKPELIVRSELHKRGLRFRVHSKRLPGKPDIVFPKFKVVVFVHGCFWHKHTCDFFQWPKSNGKFWRDKIQKNVSRDAKTTEELIQKDWRVLQIWECCVRGQTESQVANTMDSAFKWITKERRPETRGELPQASRI